MKLAIWLSMLLLASAFAVGQPAPVLFYLDIDSGPATGGEDGQGAFVCVFGEHFGVQRGDSTITLNGLAPAQYKMWSDPGTSYRPGHYAKACVQVSSKTPAGPAQLVMTTPGGTSNSIPFTVRPGKIHFVAQSGSDTLGSGSHSSPFASIKRCKQQMEAGDICYVETMTIVNKQDNFGAALVLDSSGTAGSPKAIVAYPGHNVVIDANGGPLSRALINMKPGARISYWTVAGFTFDAPVVGVQIFASDGIRLVDNDIMCTGPRCAMPAGGLVVGKPGEGTAHVTVLGNRIHDVGCHEDVDYANSAHPCMWLPTGKNSISTSGKSFSTDTLTEGLAAGDVVMIDGQLRRIMSCDRDCRTGKLDYTFQRDLPPGTPWKWRHATPPKLFHNVYFGNTNSVEFGWNEIDGGQGRACRGLLFHSTAAADEYDLHIHDNDIHDTVCDCISLSTVDPSKGPVEVYNNTLHSCGQGSAKIMQSSYAGIYVANTADNMANPTRQGEVEVFNNTIYDAGSGGTSGYNTACFAVQASGDPYHGSAGLNATNNICMQRSVNGQSYMNLIGNDRISGQTASRLVSGSNNDCFGASADCSPLSRSLKLNPEFVKPEARDFRLQPNSPVAAAGNSSRASHTDQDGKPRGPRPSIGAFEASH